jgi:hypothetical protein
MKQRKCLMIESLGQGGDTVTDRMVKQSPTKAKERCYSALWKAVILQAVVDYRKNPKMRAEVTRFFQSEYFRSLTNVDGGCIVSRLRSEIKSKGS